jgi:hypothetical protein
VAVCTLIHIPITTVITKQIADVVPFPDSANPSFYIFNYVGGGYAIISADKRVEPILAFSNTGYFKYSNNLAPGLLNWLTVNDKNMKLVQKNPSLKAPKGVTALWAEIADKIATGTVLRLAPPPPPCVTGDTILAMVSTLLQTQWGQNWPYNLLCPYNPSALNYTGDYYDPTGCVATSMAQIMYYWHYPTNYDWADMPLVYTKAYNSTGNQAVSQLMSDIGQNVSMLYAPTGSSAYSGDAANAFVYSFGYSSAHIDNYYNSSFTSYNTVINNLNAGWPFYFPAIMAVKGTNGFVMVIWNHNILIAMQEPVKFS